VVTREKRKGKKKKKKKKGARGWRGLHWVKRVGWRRAMTRGRVGMHIHLSHQRS